MKQGALSSDSRRPRSSLDAARAVAYASKVVTVALTVLLLSSCVPDDATPSQAPTAIPPDQETSSPDATGSTAPSPVPTRPAEMERSDDVGAAAAAQYFMELFPYVMQTGDLTEWDLVSAQDCVFCQNVRDDVAEANSDGVRYTGGEIMLDPPTVLNQDPTIGGFLVEVSYSIAAGSRVDAAGEAEPISPESSTVFIDTLFSAPGWVMVELSLDQNDAVFAP